MVNIWTTWFIIFRIRYRYLLKFCQLIIEYYDTDLGNYATYSHLIRYHADIELAHWYVHLSLIALPCAKRQNQFQVIEWMVERNLLTNSELKYTHHIQNNSIVHLLVRHIKQKIWHLLIGIKSPRIFVCIENLCHNFTI